MKGVVGTAESANAHLFFSRDGNMKKTSVGPHKGFWEYRACPENYAAFILTCSLLPTTDKCKHCRMEVPTCRCWHSRKISVHGMVGQPLLTGEIMHVLFCTRQQNNL